MEIETFKITDDALHILDQRFLPHEIKYFVANNYQQIILAIKDMATRGAPAIGVAAAFGLYLAGKEFANLPKNSFIYKIKQASLEIRQARPTAVNLEWALNKMEAVLDNYKNESVDSINIQLFEHAKFIAALDLATNKLIADIGNKIVPNKATILTHCNTGSLATSGIGTALGIICEAFKRGKEIEVFANETRPRLQGAKLTAFELIQNEIPATLIVDTVSPVLIRDGKIDLVLLGADRIAANGDTANKIGTYMISELAKIFNVPFYVVAPLSTIDPTISSGADIIIEERSPEEVTHIFGLPIAPLGMKAYNPAFDVTPAENITGIITEKGIIKPPYRENIKNLF